MDKAFRKVLVAAHGPTHQMVRPDVSPVPNQIVQKTTHTSDRGRARPALQESLRRYDAHASSKGILKLIYFQQKTFTYNLVYAKIIYLYHILSITNL